MWIIFVKILKSIFTDKDKIFEADVYRFFPDAENKDENLYTFNELINGYKNINFKYQCFILADRNIKESEYIYNNLGLIEFYEYVLLNKIYGVIKQQNDEIEKIKYNEQNKYLR